MRYRTKFKTYNKKTTVGSRPAFEWRNTF